MQYIASHYWQCANENSPSLLLQQVYHKEKKLAVLLACVCSEKWVITGLADWFYGTGLPLVDRKGKKGISQIGKNLERFLRQQKSNREEVWISGALCVGDALYLWKYGETKIWYLNQRNLKPHIGEWYPEGKDKNGLVFQKGFLQSEVGILLGTKSFPQPEPVNVKGWKTQREVEEWLQEQGKRTAAAAILLIAKKAL